MLGYESDHHNLLWYLTFISIEVSTGLESLDEPDQSTRLCIWSEKIGHRMQMLDMKM